MNPPVIAIDLVRHVGSMDPASKRTGSYEGAGLSVSLHPRAWRAIARGFVSGRTWTLRKQGGRFLDAHALKPSMRRAILAWGVDEGYCTVVPLWRLSYYDDELESQVTQTFSSLAEAKEESDDGERGRVRRVSGHVSTPLLDRDAMQNSASCGDRSVLDLLLPIWAGREHGLDGVWWSDRLSVVTHSAPRGVILVDALPSWSIDAAAPEDDEDDHEDDDEDEDDED